jgi:CheY-like chemotaxis protein/HPt (histidine-containing phosphotransfer) domain-containing protein
MGSQKLLGVFLLDDSGNILMQYSDETFAAFVDTKKNKLAGQIFHACANGHRIDEGQLPWRMCLSDSKPVTTRLAVSKPRCSDWLNLEATAVPLRNGKALAGVFVLFQDATESIKSDGYVSALCNMLEKQLGKIENSQRELTISADKQVLNNLTPYAAFPALAAANSTEKYPVLVVDDIPVNAQLLVKTLKKMGVESDTADNGLEAVKAARRKRYSLILMDIDMPVLDGYEATAEIRKFEADFGLHTPIVAMTSFDRAAEKYKCLKSGMDDFLAKGASKDRLRQVVAQYVLNKPEEQAAAASEEPLPTTQLKLDVPWLEQTLGADAGKMVTLFIGSAATLLSCLDYAIAEKDEKQTVHFAFSLKGPCSSLGLHAMSELSVEIADLAVTSKWAEATEKVTALREMFETIKTHAGSVVEKQVIAALREVADNASTVRPLFE